MLYWKIKLFKLNFCILQDMYKFYRPDSGKYIKEKENIIITFHRNGKGGCIEKKCLTVSF